jgi:hypothetical protein
VKVSDAELQTKTAFAPRLLPRRSPRRAFDIHRIIMDELVCGRMQPESIDYVQSVIGSLGRR